MGVAMFVQACPTFYKIFRGVPRYFSGLSSFENSVKDQGILNQYGEF